MDPLSLSFKLNLGYSFGSEFVEDVELLKANGVAERVFLAKSQHKPFTYIANIICAGVKTLGSASIGVAARKEYLDTDSITIPAIVLAMPLAEANSLLVEIHRRLWKRVAKDQEGQCKYCAKLFKTDVDLARIVFSEENIAKVADNPDKDWSKVVIDLPKGSEFYFDPPNLAGGQPNPMAQHKGEYNRFIFKAPTLGDCIRNESVADDSIKFWRRLAFDCLLEVQSVDKNDDGSETVMAELPRAAYVGLGMKLYNEVLDRDALEAIRDGLREERPTLSFVYYDDCPCPQKNTIPITMEGRNFFSE